jgi:hypothetical protein
MMSTIEIIIAMIVVSFCAAAIVGTLVYRILHKKHEEDVEWIINLICDNKTEVSRFYNKYQDHLVDYHRVEYYNNIGEDKDEDLG